MTFYRWFYSSFMQFAFFTKLTRVLSWLYKLSTVSFSVSLRCSPARSSCIFVLRFLICLALAWDSLPSAVVCLLAELFFSEPMRTVNHSYNNVLAFIELFVFGLGFLDRLSLITSVLPDPCLTSKSNGSIRSTRFVNLLENVSYAF